MRTGTSRLLIALLGGATLLPLSCSEDTGTHESDAGASGSSGKAGSSGAAGGSGASSQGGSAGKSGATGGSSSGRAGSSSAGTGQSGTGGSSGTSAGTSSIAGKGGGASGGSSGASGRGGGSAAGSGNEPGSGGEPDPGAGGDGGQQNTGGGPGGEEIPPGYVKGIIGVGYGGIRIVSRDGGLTWGSRAYENPDGGDDEDLLRAVAYGKGRWIASGWILMSSDDGINWTNHGYFRDDRIIADEVIIEGLAYKDGYFYAAGDGNPSRMYRSEDGLEWEHFGEIGDTVKHTGLTYRGGLFVSYGDSETSYSSANGLDWEEMGIDNATYCENEWKSLDDCHDAAWFDDGFYLIPEWGGDIRRSTTGSNFQNVYSDDQENTLYRARAVAEGYVAPE